MPDFRLVQTSFAECWRFYASASLSEPIGIRKAAYIGLVQLFRNPPSAIRLPVEKTHRLLRTVGQPTFDQRDEIRE